jgi:hypothetical protein|tara:strand:- start:154 stop:456 length:303 start_codon:yes stop_codon:yes gene_type:complete
MVLRAENSIVRGVKGIGGGLWQIATSLSVLVGSLWRHFRAGSWEALFYLAAAVGVTVFALVSVVAFVQTGIAGNIYGAIVGGAADILTLITAGVAAKEIA